MLGERLKQLRVKAGLSQGELAGDDLSASYVSLIESGKRQPSPEVLRSLCHRLGVSSESLFEDESDRAARTRLHELEIAYIRLALTHGERASARERLGRLLDLPDLDRTTRDEATSLLSRTHEMENDLVGAARILLPLFERSLRGECELSTATLGVDMCGYYLDAGDLHAAVRVGQQAIDAVEQRGLAGSDEHLRLAATVMSAYFELGDFLHCRLWAERLIAVAEESGAHRGRASIYWNAALVAEAAGHPAEALHYSQRALAILSEMGRERDLPRLKVDTAQLLLALDPERVKEALTLLDEALPDLQDIGSPSDLAAWGNTRGIAEILVNRPARAEQLARQSLLHFSAHPGLELARTLITLGDALVAQGRREEGLEQYVACREIVEHQCTPTRRVATLWRQLGERFACAGQMQEALDAYAQGLEAAGVHGRSRVADVAFGLQAAYASAEHTSPAVSDVEGLFGRGTTRTAIATSPSTASGA